MTDRDIAINRLEAIVAGFRQDAACMVDADQSHLIRYGEALFSAALLLETAVARLRFTRGCRRSGSDGGAKR